MNRTPSPHARAVALFASIVERPVQALCERPVDLVKPLGRATATGYRVVAEAEAVGLLERDAQCHYRRGSLARRIGLSSLGFGDLADLTDPFLTDLRESLRCTAVLAISTGFNVRIASYSLGRGLEYIRPVPVYRIIGRERQKSIHVFELRASVTRPYLATFFALGIRIEHDRAAFVGVLYNSDSQTKPSTIVRQLEQVEMRFAGETC